MKKKHKYKVLADYLDFSDLDVDFLAEDFLDNDSADLDVHRTRYKLS
jgi:hypothetical protein